MTIATTDSRESYNGNGVTTVFAFPYRFFQDSDLVVVLVAVDGTSATQVLNTDYTVSGEDTPTSGQVTMIVPPASGEKLVIYRDIPLTQETDYISGDAFPAESHERALDKLTMIVQQQQETLTRALQLPVTSDADAELPAAEPGKFLGWSGDGLSIVNLDSTGTGAGTIDTANLADGAVTEPKLASNAVSTAKVVDRAVTAAKLFAATTARLWGRVTAGSGDVEQLTGAQAESILPIGQTRIDVASAATVNLTSSAPNTDHINITGTTTITAFTVAAGRTYFVRFNAALTLTNNASIVTQSAANIVTRGGDTCVLRATAANTVEVLYYTRATPESASLGANGWQRLPSGLIIQWGSLSAASGSNSVSFPLTFPTAVRSVVITSGGPGGGATNTSNANTLATTGFTLSNLTGVTNTFYWQAIGD